MCPREFLYDLSVVHYGHGALVITIHTCCSTVGTALVAGDFVDFIQYLQRQIKLTNLFNVQLRCMLPFSDWVQSVARKINKTMKHV